MCNVISISTAARSLHLYVLQCHFCKYCSVTALICTTMPFRLVLQQGHCIFMFYNAISVSTAARSLNWYVLKCHYSKYNSKVNSFIYILQCHFLSTAARSLYLYVLQCYYCSTAAKSLHLCVLQCHFFKYCSKVTAFICTTMPFR